MGKLISGRARDDTSFGILAFERDKQIEMAKQLARHWVIEHHLRTGHLPNRRWR